MWEFIAVGLMFGVSGGFIVGVYYVSCWELRYCADAAIDPNGGPAWWKKALIAARARREQEAIGE